MEKKIERLFILMFFILLLAISSYFVATRDLSVGTDTVSYINIFEGALQSNRYRHEIGFYLFARFFTLFSESYIYYLGGINFFIGLLMYITFIRFSEAKSSIQLYIYSCFIFLPLYISNWYFTGVTNAIRQAMGLAIVFFSLSYIVKKHNIKFILVALLSVAFHKSVSLLIPFLLILYIKKITLNIISFIFLLSLIGYALGFNEKIIYFLSNFSGINLYETISLYGVEGGDGNGLWVGFDIKFVAYNFFWFFLIHFLIKMRLLDSKDEILIFLSKVYLILSIFYFIFGFGGFSNRWAYPSWLFLPILQAYILSKLKIDIKYKILLSIFVFLSFLFFLSRFTN